MSDLISRSMYKSKLLKALDVLNKEYREAILNEDNDLILAIQNQQSAYMIALRLLDNEPTAYDIDKVVEELDKASYLVPSKNKGYYADNAINLEDAIEIVKQGGVDDDVCEWKVKSNYYVTECSHDTDVMYGLKQDFKFCPYCGKKIKVVE